MLSLFIIEFAMARTVASEKNKFTNRWIDCQECSKKKAKRDGERLYMVATMMDEHLREKNDVLTWRLAEKEARLQEAYRMNDTLIERIFDLQAELAQLEVVEETESEDERER